MQPVYGKLPIRVGKPVQSIDVAKLSRKLKLQKAILHEEDCKPLTHELLTWYELARRDLPWRRTRDPYAIWVSEVMLQQTRVAAVIPYYRRFLELFPDITTLAAASEEELLRGWSGLGYYSRVRNMQRAAQQMSGTFPSDWATIRQLAGVGDYTAAAVASIAFNLPYAAVDGNVVRVLSRFSGETARPRLATLAQEFLDKERPGDWNQALMELGATVCLPRDPQCLLCPIAESCVARRENRQDELPLKARKMVFKNVRRTILVIEQEGSILFRQRPSDSRKLRNFWELPDAVDLPSAELGASMGQFRHCITNTRYIIEVVRATLRQTPENHRWLSLKEKTSLPVSTETRKALRLIRVNW